jgi:tight adherence protein B
MVIVATSFVAILGLVVGAYWLFVLRPETQAERELRRRLNPQAAKPRSQRVSLLNRVAPLSTVPKLQKILTNSNAVSRGLERLVQQSGMRVTAGQVVLGSAFGAAIGFAATFQLTKEPWIGVGVGLGLGWVPFLVLRRAARRRVARFEEQFPEAIDLIARALRAGHALTTGLGMVVDEMPDPVRSEFRLLHDRQNFGMPLPDAMKSLAERVPLLDARFFVTAVLTQRESGGNLAEVLDSLAVLIRERFRLKRQVRVLSAHGRITGWVLACLPPIITALLYAIAPDHIGKLFTDPLGLRMVAVAATLQVIGVIVMQRIIDIEI